jgi:hypothetical protein
MSLRTSASKFSLIVIDAELCCTANISINERWRTKDVGDATRELSQISLEGAFNLAVNQMTSARSRRKSDLLLDPRRFVDHRRSGEKTVKYRESESTLVGW